MKRLTCVDIILGGWLIASPFVLGYAASRPVVVIADLIPGALLVVASCWWLLTRLAPLRTSWIQSLCGLWLIIASFLLLFARLPHVALNALVVGILVLAVHVATTSAFLHESHTVV